jgi:kumamolisin
MMTQKPKVDLARSERAPVPGAREIGAADPNECMQVTVVVRHRSAPDALPDAAELGALLPADRQHMEREDFAAVHGASPDDLAKVRAFAVEHGLQVVSESVARRSVVLAGTIEAFSRAFEVELNRYSHPAGGEYRGRTGFVRIPDDLTDIIEGVFGLDNRPQAQPHFRHRKQTRAVAEAQPAVARPHGAIVSHSLGGGYDPTQVAQAYDFPANLDGSGQTIAILELGGGYQQSDLDSFFSKLGITTPSVTAVSVDGGTNSPGTAADAEVELDIEVSGAVAPKAQIAVYFTPNTDQGFLDALTTAIHDTNLKPSVISISWGGPENSWTQQALHSFDSACQDAAVVGVTIFVASGDNGATDGDPNGNLTVDFPASSPNVTGCGGTMLTAAGSAITNEQVWNELTNNEGATGGGVSQIFPLPVWQQNAGVPAAPNGSVGRGVPDVAGDADPATGYNVVVDGQPAVIGGTSAVAPLWAGLVALMNQSLGKPVGFLNPLLYTNANVIAAFHDITQGGNGGYQAGPGWDPCTGLGSPDGAHLLSALSGQPVA